MLFLCHLVAYLKTSELIFYVVSKIPNGTNIIFKDFWVNILPLVTLGQDVTLENLKTSELIFYEEIMELLLATELFKDFWVNILRRRDKKWGGI